MNELNNHSAIISGVIAGDSDRFEKPYIGLNQAPTSGNIIAIGLYGNNIKIGCASSGGWDEFGRERTITRSSKNILYEIDNHLALDLYKVYLGPYKENLPGSALYFPLSIKSSDSNLKLIRTILSINEKDNSMVFAGNISEGSTVRFMKASHDKLIDSSFTAAQIAKSTIKEMPDLAILISCIGRKIILKDRTIEEVQEAQKALGENTCSTGFYSYGEISPFNANTKCELHNQTLTIITLKES